MKAAVLVFPGSNREGDVEAALRRAGASVTRIWHAETALPAGTDLAVLPGGFSYGDYLRCGAIAARSPILPALRRHAERGGMVLGICNGFQIATEAGLLPGVLMRNAELRFICRPVTIRVERTDTPFTHHYREGQVAGVVVAHGEGNYACDGPTLERLEGEGLVAFRYCDARGELTPAANQNGSIRHIAGILSPNRRVLGMMPHPENRIDPLAGGTDGLILFTSLVSHLAAA